MMIVFRVRARRNPHAASIEDASRPLGRAEGRKGQNAPSCPIPGDSGRFEGAGQENLCPGVQGFKTGLFRAIYPRKGIGAESEKLKISKI